VGTILLNHVASLAAAGSAPLRADFVATGHNRIMRVTYAFAGFTVVSEDGAHSVLESDPSGIQPPPAHVDVVVERGVSAAGSAPGPVGGPQHGVDRRPVRSAGPRLGA